ncbi:Cobalamin biosynthesis bifunctional protein CbiET [Streptomyces sp. MH192]|uniref:precorrin-6y C5,15-methyltransferase (decarboxylating) subunit CbiE n=1 Tax=Streptomyces sp. MH192 TaxID=1945514 RepID=UPI001F32A54A|nr:precorrin-6y C5,15-methyltransferase (decarboxylating) subunit CbiE [Streptomyces sp. MH192]MCF0087517.1 Cobalamin biosynthesis bifunctional protein CbiET [Streptomyces sp. MH192]
MNGLGRITVLGTGTGAPVDEGARAAVAGAGLVVGGRRHLAAAPVPDSAGRVTLGPLAPALEAITRHLEKGAGGGPVVVLASGDPGFFGIVRVLAERFGGERLDVRPGVSSVAAAWARAGLPWDDAVVVSAHGRALRTAVNVCRAHPKVAVLTGPGAGPAELGAALAEGSGGPGGRVLVVLRALGDPGAARVDRVSPAEAAARDWGGSVNVVLCLDPARALGPARTVAGPPAGPRLGELVWDVGAGSGSVAVECARLGAAVVAVERAADGVGRIRANAAAHGVDVRVVHGEAPGVLAALADDPDAVFLGGGGAGLPDLVAACARRARRTVVVALAALDRVPAARAALTAAGWEVDGVLLQSSRLAPLPGDVTRLAAANPVFLLWGVRPPEPPADPAEPAESAESAAPVDPAEPVSPVRPVGPVEGVAL